MTTERIYNFNPGPAALPLVVLEEIQAEGAGEAAKTDTPASDEEAAPVAADDAVVAEDTTEGSEET